MKKINRLIAITLFAVITMISLVGCAGNSGNTSDSGTDEVTVDDTVDGTVDDTVDEIGSTDNASETDGPKFMIGGIGPISGPNAVYGVSVQNGAQIAVDEINAAGGINGTLLEFNMQDDETDPEKAINAYNSLKDWGMNILVGAVTSGSCVAVADVSKNDNMFQITPSGSSTSCIDGNDNVFQVCFSDPNQGIGSAQYIGESGVTTADGQAVDKVAVIYDSSDVYSSGIYEKFVQEAANQSSFEVVATEAFTADNKTDFSVQLQLAKDAGANLVFLPIYYNEASLILTQAASMEYAPVFFGCDGLDGILSMEGFDPALAEGVVLLTPFAADAQDEKTIAFVEEYQSRFNEIPNQFAADAYDAIYAIKAAIEQSGVTVDQSVSEICDGMKGAMTQIAVDGLTGTGMTWLDSGEVDKAPKAMMIVDGSYQLIQ